MLYALVIAAAILAAVPAPPPPAGARTALASVLAHNEDASACEPAQKRAMISGASLRTLGRIGNDPVVLAEVQNPCICGAQNCPYYVLQVNASHPRALLSSFGVSLKTKPAAPLPAIVVRSHDSAAVADETTWEFSNGAYQATASVRLRWADNARKPQGIPVHFAAGASSAALRGSASLGWYDTYVVDAARGQKLVIDGVRSSGRVTLSVYGPDMSMYPLKAGVPYMLPASGTYRVQIETDSETDVPYTITLAIR